MSATLIFPQGTATVTIGAGAGSGESIVVQSYSPAVVSQLVGYPNAPSQSDILGTVENTTTTFGPFAAGTTIVINAGASSALYSTGTYPAIVTGTQAAPGALNGSGTLVATALLNGIVTSTTAAAVTGTLDTGARMDQATTLAINDAFEWSVINTGAANAFTVAAGTDHTLVGAGAVAASTSGRFLTRKTAAATFVTYRIA